MEKPIRKNTEKQQEEQENEINSKKINVAQGRYNKRRNKGGCNCGKKRK